MSPRLLITRPRALAEETAERARALGFEAMIAPLLRIEPRPFLPPPGKFDALLFTSPQAPALAAAVLPQAGRPVFTVGERTASAARAAGYAVEMAGAADASAILAAIAARGHRRVLHPCGEDRAPAEPPDALKVEAVPVYRAVPVAGLGAPAIAALQEGRILATLLFSPRTAAIFAELLDQAGIDRSRQRLVAISPRAAEAAGPGWEALAVAEEPGTESLLGAARAMWQGRRNDRD